MYKVYLILDTFDFMQFMSVLWNPSIAADKAPVCYEM